MHQKNYKPMKNGIVMKRSVGLLIFVVVVLGLGYHFRDLPSEPTGITGYDYVFKKERGKVLMGIKTTMGLSPGKFIADPQYDKITTAFNNSAFLVYQGDDVKAINLDGQFAVRGLSIVPESIKFLGNEFNAGCSFVPGPGYEMESKDGQKLWWFGYKFSFGDVEKLIPGCNGAIFKKNGKYGFFEYKGKFNGEIIQQTAETVKKLKIIVKEQYDALYEVISYLSRDKFYLLARSGNKWFVLDSNGNVTKRHHPRVNSSLLKLPMTEDFMEAYQNPLQHIARFGEKDAGFFMCGLSLTDWNSSNEWESYFCF